MILYCSYCDARVTPTLSWQGIHVRAECPSCRSFLKWAPQTPDCLALVGPKPSQPNVAPAREPVRPRDYGQIRMFTDDQN